MSVPPPSSPPPQEGAAPEAPRELLVRLEESRGFGRRRASETDALRFSPQGLTIEHADALLTGRCASRSPRSRSATTDPGPAKAGEMTGRLPVLRRLSRTAVVPREEGIEGWLWTSRGGSALPSLAEDDAPNAALLFTKPLAGDVVTAHFERGWIEALAARSPLGEPSVAGLLFRVVDTVAAQEVFRRYGIARSLTDREVPPAMRRSLPTDIPADPAIRALGRGSAGRHLGGAARHGLAPRLRYRARR